MRVLVVEDETAIAGFVEQGLDDIDGLCGLCHGWLPFASAVLSSELRTLHDLRAIAILAYCVAHGSKHKEWAGPRQSRYQHPE